MMTPNPYTNRPLLEVGSARNVPEIVSNTAPHAADAFLEFFAASIRNPNTRRAYAFAVREFLNWVTERTAARSLTEIAPAHVAAWVELGCARQSPPTVKQHLAAVRMLFDWLVVRQVMPTNPAAAVRGPKHAVKQGKTPVLDGSEARAILDAISTETLAGFRDRALIGVMVYTFARVGAAIGLQVEDVHWRQRRLWLSLHEKGGKRHAMPCHHSLEHYLHDYLDAGDLRDAAGTPLFRTLVRGGSRLTEQPMAQADVWRMVQRRAAAAGILTRVCNHTFRATGITAYLKNGGTLERAAAMAAHESTRTTQLYDRRADDVTLDEVERVLI